MPKFEEKKVKKIKEIFVKSLSEGVTFTKACEGVGINRTTIWNWRREDDIFDNEINFVLDARIQDVEDALYLNATEKNNVTAQIFWLKSRGGDRWKDKKDINMEPSKENNLSEEDMNELIRLAYKSITNIPGENPNEIK
ncbi:MAG: hypothetical protein WC280_04035 [Patescibacteria group bacterium]